MLPLSRYSLAFPSPTLSFWQMNAVRGFALEAAVLFQVAKPREMLYDAAREAGSVLAFRVS